MYVIDNFAFIAHPRMASRSISDALIAAGAEQVNGHHPVDGEMLADIVARRGVVACVKRNMYDVLVSWFYRSRTQTFADGYVEDVAPKQEFEEWLVKIIQGGHQYLDPKIYHYGLTHSNYAIRFDDIDRSINVIMSGLGLNRASIGNRGVSHRIRDYREYYTEKSHGIVEARWYKDFLLTGYKF